jgi:hypothetical protein
VVHFFLAEIRDVQRGDYMNLPLRKWATVFVLAAGGASHAIADDDGTRKIRHVFTIVLENEGYDTTFGPNSKAPFLSKTLTAQGALLTQYYGTGHASLDNYIAMISGQAADNDTRADCQTYSNFVLTGVTADGQAVGSGCIYPSFILTVADQLTAAHKTWRAYMEDMGNDPNRETSTCGHPVIGSKDLTQTAEPPSSTTPLGDQYATRHNPFAYFHSIIDSAGCHANVVNLNQLNQDLKSVDTTPAYVFVTPNLCDDGHDAPCVTSQPGGLVSADLFLQKWVPTIMNSPAFQKDGGLLMILFDEGGFNPPVANPSGGFTISASGLFCCNQQPGPNLGAFPQSSVIGPYTLTYVSYGGDRTGAVLLSPFIKPGTVSNIPYNHYSMLKTVEDIFDLGYLGYAGAPGLPGFFNCINTTIANSTAGQFGTCSSPTSHSDQ